MKKQKKTKNTKSVTKRSKKSNKILVGVFKPRGYINRLSKGALVVAALASGLLGSYFVYQSTASPRLSKPAVTKKFSYRGTLRADEKNFPNENYKSVEIDAAEGTLSSQLKVNMSAGFSQGSYWTLCLANAQNVTLVCDQSDAGKTTARINEYIKPGKYYVTASYFPQSSVEQSSYELTGTYMQNFKKPRPKVKDQPEIKDPSI